MKLTPLLFTLSLASNAVLAWFWWRGAASTEPAHASVAAAAKNAAAAATLSESAPAVPMAVAPQTKLSPDALRDRLTALGFPADVVRAVVRAVIEEPRLAREREFYAQAARHPWWRGAQNFTPEQDRELRALRKAEREELLRVFGPLGYATDEMLERYSFLAPDKAARLAVLQRDYAELRRELADRAVAGDAEARERQKLIAAEHERDLAAFLSPDERAAFDDRESSSARSLSYRFDNFHATDAEYRAVLELQKTFDEKYGGSPAGLSPEALREQSAARTQLGKDIAAALGPERFAAFLQAQRSEYRALVELQRRYDIPQATFDQVARLQLDISAESARIADDRSLDNSQKAAALVALADRATTGVRAALSPALADTFLTATRATWIDHLAKGASYSTSYTGSTGVRSFAPRPAAGAPPAPRP